MIRIAICDDEESMSNRIRTMASAFFRGKNMETAILQFSGGEELLGYGGPIDILFLDIQMAGMDGMETAVKLREKGFRGFLIFITVLREMVFRSFEVQAYDYLVKPVEESRFEKTMERLLGSMLNAGEASLLVQKGYESRIIALEDIVFCEIIDRKVYLHLTSGEVVDFYDRIERLEARQVLSVPQELSDSPEIFEKLQKQHGLSGGRQQNSGVQASEQGVLGRYFAVYEEQVK